MKRLFFLLVLLGLMFVLYNRQRVFARDPLASVTRDGTKVDGMQVFINYSNDVLLENDGPPLFVTLVQHGRPLGTPANLKCLHWVACLTDADLAGLASTEEGARLESMTSTEVRYTDGQGRRVVVKLR